MPVAVKPFRNDGAGNPILGGSEITSVTETPVDNSSWTAIRIPTGKNCKQLLLQERGGGAWKLSAVANGATYFTIPANGALALEIGKIAGEVLCYAQMSAGSGTIEALFCD